MAPLQVARLGWLPRQKLPLHDGWQHNELEKYATGHKMSYENRTKSGMTKTVLPGSWGCHHCKNDRGPPQNDTLGRLAQGIATATRIEADSISECPFTLYQILSVTQSKQQSFPNTNLDRLRNTGGYHPLNYDPGTSSSALYTLNVGV